MSRSVCRDALYGQHGVPNSSGKCPYCGEQIAARGWNQADRDDKRRRNAMGRTGSITPEEELFLESRDAMRDPFGRVTIPTRLDPEIEVDWDEVYYG